MSFVKIQSGQTDEIQCPPLSMLSLEMHLSWAPQLSTPVLRPWLWDISWYIDFKLASCQVETVGVALWQIKWNPKDMKSKLSPSFTLSTPLESKRPTLASAQTVPSLNYRIRKSFPGFLSWNISEDIRNTHLLRGRASATQQEHDWLDLCLGVCATFCPGIK